MNYIIANTVIILFFLLSPLNAHYFSESFSKWNVVDNKVEANFSLLTLESTRIFQVENYQKIMFEENLSETDVFKIYLSQHLKVTSEGKNCSLVDEIKELNSQEGSLNLSLNFECPSNKEIKIINNALFNLVQSHIHIARIYIDNNLYTEKALFFNDQSIDLNEEKENNSFSNSFYKFFSLGLDHILSGYDHLLFILGLLLLVTNLKRLLLVITGFTIGHSLTLSLSVINIIQVKSSLVEALIGYTIMFVGLEYLYKENNEGGTIAGTYIHGIFENDNWRDQYINLIRKSKNLPILNKKSISYKIKRESILDNLANEFNKHLNLTSFLI